MLTEHVPSLSQVNFNIQYNILILKRDEGERGRVLSLSMPFLSSMEKLIYYINMVYEE